MSEAEIIQKILADIRPERPGQGDMFEMSDQLWMQVEQCWRRESLKRPLMVAVVDVLDLAFGHDNP